MSEGDSPHSAKQDAFFAFVSLTAGLGGIAGILSLAGYVNLPTMGSPILTESGSFLLASGGVGLIAATVTVVTIKLASSLRGLINRV